MERYYMLETFVRVVDAGSFSVAARQLHISQSGVSKTIARLETWLGVRLLQRTTRALTVTEAGRHFYARAKRAVEEAEAAVLAARGADAELSGKLRVLLSPCLGRLHVMRELAQFLERHPGLDLEISLSDGPVNLAEQGIDAGFQGGAPAADVASTARKLGSARRLLVATPNYLERHGEPRHPEDLKTHACIGHATDSSASWTFRRGEAAATIVPGGRLKVGAAEGLREAVLAHLGLAIASEWYFAAELAAGTVRPCLSDWSLPIAEYWAIFPAGRSASVKALAFAEFVEACFPVGAELA